jgi:hypothetical protein
MNLLRRFMAWLGRLPAPPAMTAAEHEAWEEFERRGGVW